MRQVIAARVATEEETDQARAFVERYAASKFWPQHPVSPEIAAQTTTTKTSEKAEPDYHGPLTNGKVERDEVHERVHDVVRDILVGNVIKPARDQIRDALNRAPEPKKGFPSRALSFPNQQIGLIMPGWRS